MKKLCKNKALSPLMLVAMIVILSAAVTGLALAGSGATITVGSTASAAAPGDNVTIPVTITNNPGIAALGFKFTYDSNALTLNSISADSDGKCSSNLLGSTANGNRYLVRCVCEYARGRNLVLPAFYCGQRSGGRQLCGDCGPDQR